LFEEPILTVKQINVAASL